MTVWIAVIADSEVRVGPLGSKLEPIRSRFVEQFQAKSEAHAAKNAWKREDRSAGLLPASALWGQQAQVGPNKPIATSISRGLDQTELIYVMEAAAVHNLFKNRWLDGVDPEKEYRVATHRDRRISDLAAEPGGSRFACAITGKLDTTHLAVMDGDGVDLVEVTAGDSEDSAPCWHPQSRNTLVYQSSGLARSPDGAVVGHGPCSLLSLEIKSGKLETLHEDPSLDFVAPRFDREGRLCCIRRPYRSPFERASLVSNLIDSVLAPFRLVMALAAFLDFFARKYSGRSLQTRSEEEIVRSHQALARRRTAQLPMPMIGQRAGSDDVWRVPEDWELVRYEGGSAHVLARRVLDFDFAPDGALVYTDGRSIVRVSSSGATETVGDQPRIQRLVVLGSPP